MDTRFETANDTKVNIEVGGGDTKTDYSCNLANDDGVDLNAASSMSKSHAEQFRGATYDFLSGASSYVSESTPTSLGGSLAGIGFDQREALGQMAYHGSAALMEGANNQYGNPSGELQNMQIQQAIEAGAESAERTEPIEPIPYDEIPESGLPIYDGETGIDLTDPRLEGYGSLDEVPPKLSDELRNGEKGEDLNALSDDETETKIYDEDSEVKENDTGETEVTDNEDGAVENPEIESAEETSGVAEDEFETPETPLEEPEPLVEDSEPIAEEPEPLVEEPEPQIEEAAPPVEDSGPVIDDSGD